MPRALPGATKVFANSRNMGSLSLPPSFSSYLPLSFLPSFLPSLSPSLLLSLRGKPDPHKYCLMTCVELNGRRSRHPTCHIFCHHDKERKPQFTQARPEWQPLRNTQLPPSQKPRSCAPASRCVAGSENLQETTALAHFRTSGCFLEFFLWSSLNP